MSRAKIKKEEYKKIVDMYNNGMSQQAIADAYKCSKQVIYRIMKIVGAKARHNGFTKDDAINMYNLYNDGMRVCEIAKLYNIDHHVVSSVLKRNGFVIDRKLYHCNDNYFDIIDIPDKAYILGLLWADGHNDISKGKITLQLQEKDKKILDDITLAVSSDRPLWLCNLHDKNENWSNAYTLTLNSEHISKVLYSYGMVQRKSLILEPPNFLDESLYSHFIRGYFDGDGSISYNPNKNYLQVSMIGTPMMCKWISDICAKINVKTFISNNKNMNPLVCTFGITNIKDRIKFLDWLYNDANLKLKRKYDKYQQFIYDKNMNNSLAS